MNHFLCCRLGAQPSEHTLCQLITKHPRIKIFYGSKLICFSAQEPAALMIISQQLKSGIYPGFFKESYEMLVQTEEQLQFFLKDLLLINNMNDIHQLFQKEEESKEGLNRADFHIGSEQKQLSLFQEKKLDNESYVVQHKNVRYVEVYGLQKQEERETLGKHEDDQIKKVELQFQEQIEKDYCLCAQSNTISQTKQQPLKSNTQKVHQSDQIPFQTSIQVNHLNSEPVQKESCQNQSQLLQPSQQYGDNVYLKIEGQHIPQNNEQITHIKIVNDAQIKFKQSSFVLGGNSQQKVNKFMKNNNLMCKKESSARAPKYLQNMDIFLILFLATWIILLLVMYS